MNSLLCRIIGFCLLIHTAGLAAAVPNLFSSKYTFSCLDVNNGLPINFIDDIYKDSRGFIWIATQGGGLCRYDGYEFVNFNVNSDFIFLKSNFIRKVCEDNFGRLWIASDYGLDVINLRTMTPAKIGLGNKDFLNLRRKTCNTLLRDLQGNMWIVSSSSIEKISFQKDGGVKRIAHTISYDPEIKNDFTAIAQIKGQVLVARNGFIEQLAEAKPGKLSSKEFSGKLAFGYNLYISSLIEQGNNLWIGTENGLFRYGIGSGQLDKYSYDASDPHSISQDMITSLELTNDGLLVIGTLKGINLLNPETQQLERISSHGAGAPQLNSDFINCLLSEGNNLWVGTEAGGINKLTLKRLDIRNYKHDENPSSLSPNPVNSILEDHQGNLWVGTVEGGLNLRKKGESDFIHFRAGKGSITHNSVSALEEDRNGNLWIATWGGGISMLNLNKLSQKVFSYLPSYMNYVAVLKYDPVNHGVWIGTNRQIFFFDIQTNSVKSPLNASLTRNLMGTLGCIIDERNRLWIGTTNGVIIADLNAFDHNKFTCKANLLQLPEEKMNQFFLKNITAIYQSKDHSIWMSSNGYGVCQIQESQGKLYSKTFISSDGLANNSCLSLIEDNQGLIWVGTGNGLSCYNPHRRQFINYARSDGLNSIQFYWNAGYKSRQTNKIYFGNMAGLTEIDTKRKDVKETPRKTIFTKLQVLNETVNASKEGFAKEDIAYANRIELHESAKSFVIEFSSLDYDSPSTVNYSYRLLGFDDKWINTSSDRRFVSYTNLSPGTYHLQLRCSNASGEWSNQISELTIVVHPYFYKTIWFNALMILFVGGCAVQLYRWRIRELKRQKTILHRKVEERTGELARQTVVLKQQAIELKQQNQRLSQQNDKITLQRKQLMDMSEKVQEALNDRISFFTNITHEFRTPITLIVGPIERALKLSTNPKVIEQLQFVSHNSRNLLSLVNQLMDFRKIESDTIRIEPKAGDIIEFMNDMLVPFDSFVMERGILLRKMFRVSNPNIVFDNEALRKLITNLLSNAIKFTPDSGIVSLYTAILHFPEKQVAQLYLCICDNGIGVNKAELESIFERFYQSKVNGRYPVAGQSGTGIGLYLCRRIVELMGGTIYAKNNCNKGASFRVIIPLPGITTFNQTAKLLPKEIDPEAPPSGCSTKMPENKCSILIVEDNKDMRQYLKSILNEIYVTSEAENGKQALSILRSKHIDFIISDLMMPEMDGLELSKQVKADLNISHIPFLMLTAKTGKQTQINSYRMGVDDILFKPFDEEVLVARIQNILETRHNYQLRFSLNMDIQELNIEKESADEKFIRKAMQTVRDNYRDPEYEVYDFILAIGMSKTLIHKKMQTLLGQSPGNFIRNFRLNKARELLLDEKNEQPISEVAYQVGFNDPKYFTRCFTKHYGVAPSSFTKESNKSGTREIISSPESKSKGEISNIAE